MKKLFNNKKGLFYLIIAVLLIAIMGFIFVAYREYSYSHRQKVIETRIMSINDFIKDIDSDSKRVIYISGFRSLIALEDYIARTGRYLNNTEEVFRIAFYNGTVNGTQVEIMVNSSYSDYLNKLRYISDKVGIDITLNITDVTLYHDSPWSVNVVVTAHVNVTDKKDLVEWDFYKDYNASISLFDIRDPVYSVATTGRAPNTIRVNITSDFVDDAGNQNDTTMLQIFLNNSYYISNPLAPSFLMRMEGNFSSSPYGIESLVNLEVLNAQDVEHNQSRSIVDYILFSNITGYEITYCDVQNMPEWFIIDKNHTNTYEVNEVNYTLC